nr:hypothetical protein [uncultured Terrisporobacter sp.]
MTNINEFNITEEELKEIEEITELAQGCTDYFLDSLINPETKEKVELTEEEKKSILKLVIHKTMDYIEENSFPANEEDFAKYVEVIFVYLQEKLS